MINILQNYSLKKLNTFGIEALAKHFVEINSEKDYLELFENSIYKTSEKFILGGGSNILFTKNFEGLVIKNVIKGINIVKEEKNSIYVKSAAGEVWHDLVNWCIAKNFGGIENLSLIPGCVGASPMQNIGAYGVEIKDVFEELEAYDLQSGKKQTFNNSSCKFGYRESIFKHADKNKYLIVSVTFKLAKHPKFNVSYGAIKEELEKMGVKELNIKHISQAVINIRNSKLPDPQKIGNAGSFFKNPEVEKVVFEKLKSQYPQLVAYPLQNGNYKLAAGWLIEQSGLKGHVSGNACVHDKQALVLVNKGNATGEEIYSLSEYVLQTVFAKFGVNLEREVNIM